MVPMSNDEVVSNPMAEPNLDELRQKIYDVLNVHTPAGCAGRHCWGVEALEKLISDQVAKAKGCTSCGKRMCDNCERLWQT